MKKIPAILLTITSFSLSAQVKINDMPTITNLKNAYIPAIQGGVNKKIPTDSIASIRDLRDSILSGIAQSSFRSVSAMRTSNYYLNKLPFYSLSGYYASGDGGGGYFYYDYHSTATDDGIFCIKPAAVSGAGRFVRIQMGDLTAAQAGIKSDGTNQASVFNIVLANPLIKRLVISDGDIIIGGRVDVPAGKILIFQNGRIKGNGGADDTLYAPFVQAPTYQQIFDSSLTVVEMQNREIPVTWFGAVADCGMTSEAGTTDNWPYVTKAIKATYHLENFTTFYRTKLYFPSVSSKSYYFSKRLDIQGSLEIYGDGIENSILNWPRGVAGMRFMHSVFDTTSRPAIRCYMHDLTLSGFKPAYGFYAGVMDSVSYGIILHSGGHNFERVRVMQFQADGVNVYGADECIFSGCEFMANSGSGIAFHGEGSLQEANQHILTGCFAKWNGRSGFEDKSFLGNQYFGCSTSANADSHPNNRSAVTTGAGKIYQCIKDNIGVKPGVTAGWQTYWEITNNGGFHFNTWDATTRYIGAGAFQLDGANQRGGLFGCYTEGDQAAGRNNSPSLIIGGFASSMAGFTMRNAGGLPFFHGLSVIDDLDSVEITLRGQDFNLIGWQDNRFGGTRAGFYYDNATKGVFMAGVEGAPAFVCKTDKLRANYAGRSSLPATYNAFFYKGAWLGVDNSIEYRNICYGRSVPTTGKWAAGDFVINISSDTTLIGWRCTTSGDFAGTPPVFHMCVTGTSGVDINNSTGNNQWRQRTSYTPTSTRDTKGNTGDFSWDNNFIYVKTSAGWKRAALTTF
jgi:hypothetical protein